MRVLCTGVLGFIGSHFARYMIKQNFQVIGVNRLGDTKNLSRIQDLQANANFKLVYADLTGDISGILEDVDVVVNFAAKTHVDHSIVDPEPFIRSNILGTYKLIEQARKYKIKKYIQISTDEVYGSIMKGYADEKSPLNPTNPYSACKASADMLVNSYVHTFKLPAVVVRCENNYGIYQHPQKAVPTFIRKALKNENLPIYGDGKHRRMWLYVEDFCSAIQYAIDHGKIGEVYNVGAKNEIENIYLARKILNILHKPHDLLQLIPEYDIRPGHDRRYAIETKKLEDLGWKSKFDFDKTLENVVNWYKENQWWFA